MDSKMIRTRIKRLEGSLYGNLLKKRAKSNNFSRVFFEHGTYLVHLIEEPDRNHLYYYYHFLCIEDAVAEPSGILLNSAISLTQGSRHLDNHYGTPKLCPKCFKYVNPSDVLRLEAGRKREKGKATMSQAGDDNVYLVRGAEELEHNADGLDSGSIRINLKENTDMD